MSCSYCTSVRKLFLEVHGGVNGDSYRGQNGEESRWELHVCGSVRCRAAEEDGSEVRPANKPAAAAGGGNVT